MYEISIEDTFDAAHCLREYQGNCERLHGHTYKAKAVFQCASLDKIGIAIDFRMAKKLLEAATDYLDHQYINDLPEFSVQNPTAENIARYIFDRIKAENQQIHSVSVWETPTSCATYYEEA